MVGNEFVHFVFHEEFAEAQRKENIWIKHRNYTFTCIHINSTTSIDIIHVTIDLSEEMLTIMKHHICITVGDMSIYLINDWRGVVILTFTVTGALAVPVADGLVTVPAGILIVSVALFTRLPCKDLFFRLFVYGPKVFFRSLYTSFY